MNKLCPRASQTAVLSSSDSVNGTRPSFPLSISLILMLCVALPALAQDGQPREATSGDAASANADKRISGRVVGDDGKPLADAVVNIFRMYARVPGPPVTANTDGEGRFQSQGLAPGLYAVSAISPGYASAQPDVNERGEPNYYRPGESVSITLVKGGVITGTVKDANGEPVVALPVRAVRLREPNSSAQAARFMMFARDRMTDDRGVYRIFGLSPGTYLVYAGGNPRFFGGFNAYGGDVPVYFPSSTRDTAAEVRVGGGEEVTNVDIRYRSERGRTVSGQIVGANETDMRMGISVILRQSINAGFTDQTFIQPVGKPVFAFSGLTDGEYDLIAQQGSTTGETVASAPRRVTVKGGDVTGVELTLTPLAAIAGRAVLEPEPKEPCGGTRVAALPETIINMRRDVKGAESRESSVSSFFSASATLPDEQGDFLIRSLAAGSYRFNVRLPDDFWYTRSISLPGAATTTTTTPARARPAPAAKPAPTKSAPAAPSYIITLRAGERSTGTIIQVAQDGATLRGKISPSAEGASLPDNLKVYLIPREHERAEDILRFSETNVTSDGAFIFRNLAPGGYLILARPAPENESPESVPRPAFWDADSRARLRREAEAINAAIDLKPCQRISDYGLRYPVVK